ncbi:hypothetical protein SAMN06893096_102384 [Geodermatophilus pulveris]|uniref:Uncharacterized protein n=1 Tax=Geodermatophilus pulveris TaxID=1564159 RepID=A0A239CDG8_9ACTN|nr:hypothetical protein [Geodermatophilus pulveris]SNS18130.1 hypothetical protein SAMN06893096_102384 [Geodermatophilus pulveris]
MTVLPLPDRGRWVWDARDRTRAVRVSTHGAAGLLNLSVWRDDVCVGTVKLRPDEAAELVGALTEGLARLAGPPAPDAARLAAVEDRLAGLEARLAAPPGRRVADGARAAAAAVAGQVLRRLR